MTNMRSKLKTHLTQQQLSLPSDIATMLCASFCNMSKLLPNARWFSQFLTHVMSPAMTNPYRKNVFPMLRQLCSIIRIDCSHRTTKNRREKVKYSFIDPKTKQKGNKVRMVFL